MNAIIVRQAELKDISFLAKTVIEADKSGTPKSSYGKIFGMDEEQLKQAFETLFTFDLEDCEFSVASFCVCEIDGKPAGACAAWIENLNDLPSWQIKSSAMRFVISNEAKLNLQQLNSLLSSFMPARTSGYLQIESVYVEPAFRGLGVLGKMLSFQESLWRSKANPLSIEVMTYTNNATAIRGYEKYGFKKDRENNINDETILTIYPAKGMVVLIK
jgi:ribosomal protein S18 acetylase RimI-like enzyme